MTPREALAQRSCRRTFLCSSAGLLGGAALSSLLPSEPLLAVDAPPSLGIVNPLHLAAKAKRVIFLCMAGGPSHLETLDYKPKLAELHGKILPIALVSRKKRQCILDQALQNTDSARWLTMRCPTILWASRRVAFPPLDSFASRRPS